MTGGGQSRHGSRGCGAAAALCPFAAEVKLYGDYNADGGEEQRGGGGRVVKAGRAQWAKRRVRQGGEGPTRLKDGGAPRNDSDRRKIWRVLPELPKGRREVLLINHQRAEHYHQANSCLRLGI